MTVLVHDAGFAMPEVDPYLKIRERIEAVVAVLIAVAVMPIIAICYVLVRATSRGPGFYSQIRAGKDGKPFAIYKLRTMQHECEKKSGAQWATKNDPRITPCGRILRATHLDELPQIVNVLRGEMSLIGPRPERPEFVEKLQQAIPRYRDRLSVKPGVTGLAQVLLPPDTDLDSVRRKLRCDLFYLHNVSFMMDVKILLGTFFHVLSFSGDQTAAIVGLPSATSIETGKEPLRLTFMERRLARMTGN